MIYTIELGKDLGIKYQKIVYPAGEMQVRLLLDHLNHPLATEIHEVHVIAKAEKYDAEWLMELSLLTDALREEMGLPRMILFLPYLPYSRADRRFCEGDCYGLKVFAECINSLCYDRVMTLDAHSYKARQCVNNLINVDPSELIEQAIEHSFGSLGDNGTIILPDEGAKRYKFDKTRHLVVQCSKIRDEVTGKLSGFKVPKIVTKKALIVDDICDGGGTFLGIKKELPDIQLSLYVSHGVFSKGLYELYHAFENIYTTDSFTSNSFELPGLRVFSSIPVLKKAII